jgi:hypothetical protein
MMAGTQMTKIVSIVGSGWKLVNRGPDQVVSVVGVGAAPGQRRAAVSGIGSASEWLLDTAAA